MTAGTPGAVRVRGFMQARDQWPLIALSVTHALQHHVDDLTVLLHCTTDGSFAGLARLRERWGDRLQVRRYEGEGFQQEATTNSLVAAVAPEAGEWVYVLDADEFLLTDQGRSLRELLADVGPDVASVRYEVHNWVAPTTLDEARLDGYRAVRARAVPTLFRDLDGPLLADEVARGFINFFDVTFPSKVIVRAGGWVSAGSHAAVGIESDQELALPPALLRVGHLPYPSRDRLSARARHGGRLIADGFPPRHGWQNQMMWRLEKAGGLDAFWQAHSLGSSPPVGFIEPVVVIDDALQEALDASLVILEEEFGPVLPRDPAGPEERAASPSAGAGASDRADAGVGAGLVASWESGSEETVAFEALVGMALKKMQQTERAGKLANEARGAEDLVLGLKVQIDALLAERAALAAQCTSLDQELDQERTRLAVESERADSLARVLDELVRSRSWRLTSGLRRAAVGARRGRDLASVAGGSVRMPMTGAGPDAADHVANEGAAAAMAAAESGAAAAMGAAAESDVARLTGPPLVAHVRPASTGPAGWSTTCRALVEGSSLWFTADRAIAPVGEAFGSAVLPAALLLGRPLHLDAPLSATWLAGADEIGRLASRWWGWNEVGIRGAGHGGAGDQAAGPGAASPPDTDRGIGMAFSGGVDSFHALLTSAEPIDLLVSVWGFDIPLADDARWRAWDASFEALGQELGIDIVRIRTNIRDHPVASLPGWVRSHGSALAAIGHLMCGSIHEFRVASTNPTALSESTWGSNWVMDPLWSSDTLRVRHVGEELWRSEKLEAIAGHPLVQRHLRVCWEHRGSEQNCGACEKCVRTQVTLDSMGLLGKYLGFPSGSTLVDRVDALAPCPNSDLLSAYEQHLIPGSAGPLKGALERFVQRSRAIGDPGLPRP